MVEITDRGGLESWLRGKPRAVSVAIAARAALRVFPFSIHLTRGQNQGYEAATLTSARGNLIAFLSFRTLSDKILMAADSIAKSANAIYGGDAASVFFDVYGVTDVTEYAVGAAISQASSAISHLYQPYDVEETDNLSNSILSEASSDAEELESGRSADELMSMPLWSGENPVQDEWNAARNRLAARPEDWSFWIDWYQRLLDGRPQNREMLEEIALIDPEDWDRGAAHVNSLIARIQAKYDRQSGSAPATASEVARVKEYVLLNRDALAVSIAGILPQIAEYREKVRGNNQLEEGRRQEILDYLDNVAADLEELMRNLPQDDGEISDETAQEYVAWGKRFAHSFKIKGKEYIEPENVAGAVIPTAIILGCTGIGAMLGSPAVGGVVGALITNQMKPAKAAQSLLDSQDDAD